MAESASKHDADKALALLRQGADPNGGSLDGTPALAWAAHYSDSKLAEELLNFGADPNRATRLGLTPLHIAGMMGNDTITRMLLRAGANPDAADPKGMTPLMMAARQGSAATVRQLLKAGASVELSEKQHGVTPLMLAGWHGHPEVTELLLDAGARVDKATKVGATPRFIPPGFGSGSHGDGIIRGGIPPQGRRAPIPGGMTALHYAIRAGDLKSAKMLVDAGAPIEGGEANGVRPLLMAILNNRIDIAEYFVSLGADVNAKDFYTRTPLWAAVELRNLEYATDSTVHGVDRPQAFKLIELLLKKGANPNSRLMEYPPTRMHLMQGGDLSWVDFTGQTPYLRASLSGDVDTMRLLLRYKADPNIATLKGTTPLMAAAGVNWVFFQTFDEGEDKLLEAIRLNMKFGQKVTAENSMKVTALHGAANRGSDKILRFLVDNGADLQQADDQGRTALSWAEGVFLASIPAQPKPSTMALIQKLCAERNLRCEGRKPTAPAPPPAGAPQRPVA